MKNTEGKRKQARKPNGNDAGNDDWFMSSKVVDSATGRRPSCKASLLGIRVYDPERTIQER